MSDEAAIAIPDKLSRILLRLAEDRRSALEETDKELRAEKSRDLLLDLMQFSEKFMGLELLASAYGAIEGEGRVAVLEAVAARTLLASMLFAKLPDDPANLDRVAIEAMSIAGGDEPFLFARRQGARKKSFRLARMKFTAIAWNVYLENLGISSPERHSRIAIAFGQEWDTIYNWHQPVRKLLGHVYCDYFLGRAAAEGQGGKPFSFTQSFDEKRMEAPIAWQDVVRRDGSNFISTQRGKPV